MNDKSDDKVANLPGVKNRDLFTHITDTLNNWRTNTIKAEGNLPSDDDIKNDVQMATEAFLEQVAQDENPDSEKSAA